MIEIRLTLRQPLNMNDIKARERDQRVALDKLRSFAEARASEHELIRDGLTYGDARALLGAFR